MASEIDKPNNNKTPFKHLDTVFIECQVWKSPDECGLISVIPQGCVEFIHGEAGGTLIKVPPDSLWCKRGKA